MPSRSITKVREQEAGGGGAPFGVSSWRGWEAPGKDIAQKVFQHPPSSMWSLFPGEGHVALTLGSRKGPDAALPRNLGLVTE